MLDNKVIQEIITTETTYNESLALLEIGFENDELVRISPVLLKFQPLIPQLKTISDSVLDNIEKIAVKGVSESDVAILRAQRTQLLKAFFIAYQSYTAIYDSYTKEMVTNPNQFNEMEQFITAHNDKQLKLSDYLIQHLQRGPRYSLLVNAAIENNQHLDNTQLEQLTILASQIKTCLLAANEFISKEEAPGYKAGDWSRAAGRMAYSAVSKMWKKAPTTQVISAPIMEDDIDNDNDNDNEFVMVQNV